MWRGCGPGTGTGGLFRSSWDPILIASRGTPDAVDRAAVRNVIETGDDVGYANYPAKRTHPYEKPPGVLWHILARVCRPGDLLLDPFAGVGQLPRCRGEAGPVARVRVASVPRYFDKQANG